MAGKGDSPRPKSISDKEYTKNFERIFGKKIMWWEKKKVKDNKISKEKS